LGRIHTSGNHLLALINNVLDLSKIEAGKMNLYFETFEVQDMINDVVDTIKPLAGQNANSFQVTCSDDAGKMHSDLTKVRQTLFNLLANACKFTSEGSITLDVSRRPGANGDHLRFAVTDTGIGLTPEQLDTVFEAFSQADELTSSEFGGTGLGLAITRSFCQLLGGGVTVESEIGKGSTFVVELSADMRGRGASPRSIDIDMTDEKDAADKGPTVLVIDDDPMVRDLLRRHLQSKGYQTVMAESGEIGIRLAREIRPAAITLDVLMPKMDGWAVLTALKDDPELAKIPVIMLTIVEDRNLGFSLGATDYLSKPVDRDKLVAILDRCCPALKQASVLVVEDDEPTRRMLSLILEKEGCAVVEAENGVVGLKRMEKGIPDLIVLDLLMPEMDGFEFLSHVGKNETWRKVPVVVLTAKKLTAGDRKRLEGGVELLLEKGEVDPEALLSLLREVIEQGGKLESGAAKT
ncbi:MAG: response regulator, partial [Proteobacteria bacterium]|nr:response regulator [Pseudomonadota bacterium]